MIYNLIGIALLDVYEVTFNEFQKLQREALYIYMLLGTLWQQYWYVTNVTFLKNVVTVSIICFKNVVNAYIFHYAWKIGYRFCQNFQKFILKRHGKKIVLLCQM